jgi:hypothetical protein
MPPYGKKKTRNSSAATTGSAASSSNNNDVNMEEDAGMVADEATSTMTAATGLLTTNTAATLDVSIPNYNELLNRKEEIQERLNVISIPEAAIKKKSATTTVTTTSTKASSASPVASPTAALNEKTNNEIPFVPKTDTHWDFVMKGKNL